MWHLGTWGSGGLDLGVMVWLDLKGYFWPKLFHYHLWSATSQWILDHLRILFVGFKPIPGGWTVSVVKSGRLQPLPRKSQASGSIPFQNWLTEAVWGISSVPPLANIIRLWWTPQIQICMSDLLGGCSVCERRDSAFLLVFQPVWN